MTTERPRNAPQDRRAALLRSLAVLALLFVFLVGVKGLSDGFKHLGRDVTDAFFTATANPFIGLMVGILGTTLLQSSSVSTSMIVALVAAPENPLPVASAVPMIMGANIGTTVTNTFVSLAHVGRREEFRRAFSVATCHDFFNFVAVATLLPLELVTGYLQHTAEFLASNVGGLGGVTYHSPLKSALQAGATPISSTSQMLFESQPAQAAAMIVAFGLLIFIALVLLVRVMRSAVKSRIEVFITRFLGRSMVLSLIVGATVTVMVQSSSITTSLLVPLAGAGILSLRAAFPVTVGANIGTTITALLASLAASGENAEAGLVIALVHTLFNITATLLILPIPAFRNIPMAAARKLADAAVVSRPLALIYVVVLFYGIPALAAFLFR